MWDEKTVENIAPTNSVRTPYELTVGNWTPANSDELRQTGPWKTWIRKFVQNLCVKIRWICMWFGVFLPKPSMNWCGFPWKQPVWALFSPYFHIGISDQTKPRQTPTNPDEPRRTPTNSTSNQVFKGAHCFQSEWQKILAFRPTLGSFANFQNQQRQSSFSWLNIGFLGLQLQILFVLKNTAQNCKYQLEINESVVQAGMIKLWSAAAQPQYMLRPDDMGPV